jgi:hypothetical protein
MASDSASPSVSLNRQLLNGEGLFTPEEIAAFVSVASSSANECDNFADWTALGADFNMGAFASGVMDDRPTFSVVDHSHLPPLQLCVEYQLINDLIGSRFSSSAF